MTLLRGRLKSDLSGMGLVYLLVVVMVLLVFLLNRIEVFSAAGSQSRSSMVQLPDYHTR